MTHVFDTNDSQAIEQIAYDVKGGLLTVKFRRGQTYQYRRVAAKVVTELLNAPSRGRFLLQQIVGRYDSQRI